jgi:peptidyl-prolyl cis-trans isomerase D
MLEGMRKASENWMGRLVMALVMGFISLSFLIWGVGDIFRNFGSDRLAKVGNVEISAESFRQAYQVQLQNLQRQLRRVITNDQARAAGVDQQVLGRLVADAALDNTVRTFGLAISDAEIAKTILTDPAFAGANGKFDQMRFNEVLRDNGYSEQTLVREQRNVYLRQEIVDALAGDMIVPATALAAVHRYRTEAREFDFITLTPDHIEAISEPTDADLASFYDARKATYRAPEYRKIITLTLSPEKLAESAKVSDEDARARYEKTKTERYMTPETRAIEQIVFEDAAKAKAASDQIKAGTHFDALAKEQNLSIVKLGLIEKNKIIDSKIADAAFAIKENSVSEPVEGQFGATLIHVSQIIPSSIKPYSDVAAEIKNTIALERARTSLNTARDKIEDERTSGKDLTQAAKSAGFEVRVIEAIDASGHDPRGNEVPDISESDNVLRAVFASDIGVDNDTISLRNGGATWFEVAHVEPARDKSLDEVKDQVKAQWRDDEIARRLAARAADLVKKINDGTSIVDVAKSIKDGKIQHGKDVKRIDQQPYDQALVAQLFNVTIGKASSVAVAHNNRVIFKVLSSTIPPFKSDDEVMKSITPQLRNQYAEDMLTEYLTKLQNDLGVTINQNTLRYALGASDN